MLPDPNDVELDEEPDFENDDEDYERYDLFISDCNFRLGRQIS